MSVAGSGRKKNPEPSPAYANSPEPDEPWLRVPHVSQATPAPKKTETSGKTPPPPAPTPTPPPSFPLSLTTLGINFPALCSLLVMTKQAAPYYNEYSTTIGIGLTASNTITPNTDSTIIILEDQFDFWPDGVIDMDYTVDNTTVIDDTAMYKTRYVNGIRYIEKGIQLPIRAKVLVALTNNSTIMPAYFSMVSYGIQLTNAVWSKTMNALYGDIVARIQ